jgi:hypothetical protein
MTVLVVAAAVWAPVALTSPPGSNGQGLLDAAFAVAGGEITWTTACATFAAVEAFVQAVLVVGLRLTWTHRGSLVDSQPRSWLGAEDSIA